MTEKRQRPSSWVEVGTHWILNWADQDHEVEVIGDYGGLGPNRSQIVRIRVLPLPDVGEPLEVDVPGAELVRPVPERPAIA